MLTKAAGYGAYALGMFVALLGPLIFAIRTTFSTSTAVVGSLVSVACVVVSGALMTLGHMATVFRRRRASAVGDLRGQIGMDFIPDDLDSRYTVSMLAAFKTLVPSVTRFTWVRFTSGKHWGIRVAGFSTASGEDCFVVRTSASEEKRKPAYLSLNEAVTFVRAEATTGPATASPAPAAPPPDAGHAALNDEWVVSANSPESAQATVTDAVVDALNSYGQPGVTAVAGPDDVFVWSSPGAHADPGVAASLSEALYAAHALPFRRLGPDDEEAATPAQAAGEDARIGRLRTDSAGRAQRHLRGIAGLISAGLLAAVAVVTRFSPSGGDPTNAWYLAAIQAAVLIVAGIVVMELAPDLEGRQRAVATHALHLADSQGWRYQQEDMELERGWEKRPFGSVKRLTASPAASGPTTRRVLGGVAYLEGDLGVWPLFRVFSSRVVWAALPPGVPQMSIVRHNFRSRVAEMAGWGAVEVESDQFNRAWRVTASDPRAAHALLTPVVIDVLNAIAIEGISFLLDGERVVLWDDGRTKQVDLDARLELVDHLAAAVPRFWDKPSGKDR